MKICACEDGRQGAQTCADDGTRYEPCVCAGVEGEGEEPGEGEGGEEGEGEGGQGGEGAGDAPRPRYRSVDVGPEGVGVCAIDSG